MFEWQSMLIDGWLGRTRSGRWSAPTCGLSVPRQNGKSLGTIEARSNYGMLVLGEQVVYTAHLQKTATETFEDMAVFFTTKAMSKHVKDIKEALGREQIVLKSGARIKFLARTRNGGRGQHGDLLIFDEAQELDDKQQASFLPAISASYNPQTIYGGTPPDEGSAGVVFRRIRADAISGKAKRTAWAEWSVPKIPADPTDQRIWAATNPSLGMTIQPSTIATEVEQLDADKLARERFGWWSETRPDCVISEDAWEECRTDSPPAGGVVVYAVKFSPDGNVGSLSACIKPADGPLYVECIDNRSMVRGVSQLADWLIARSRGAAQIVIDGKAHSETLYLKLRAAKVGKLTLVEPNPREVAAACAMFANSVAERTVSHFGQPALDESVTKSRKRKIGSAGGWGFDGGDETDETLVESVALALWGAATTKRNPSRKMRVG